MEHFSNFNMQIDKQTSERLQSLSKNFNTPKSVVVRRALKTFESLYNLSKDKGDILVLDKSGNKIRILI